MKKLLLSLSAIAALSLPALADTYKLVSSQSDFEPGAQYLFVCSSKSMAMGKPSTTTNNKYYTNVAAEIVNDMIVTDDSTYEIITIEATDAEGTYYLHGPSGYINATAAKAMGSADTPGTGSKWTVTIADGGEATVKNSTTSYGWIQYNSGSPRFLNYASAQTAIQLFKKDENAVVKTLATLEFPAEKYEAYIGEAFTAPTLEKKETDGALTWISSDEEVATVSADGSINILKAGVTTITVTSAETDEYYSGNTSYTLVVIDPNNKTVVFSELGFANQEEVKLVKVAHATILFDKNGGTAPAYYTSGTQLRTYNGNLITVSVPEGYVLKSVTFVPQSASYWCMKVAEEQPGAFDGYVWTPGEGEEVASVTFTNETIKVDDKTSITQSRLKSITVDYEPLKAPVTVPDLVATGTNGVFTFEAEEGVTYTYTLNGGAEQFVVEGNTISVAGREAATLYAILLHADGEAAEAPVYAVTAPAPVLGEAAEGKRLLTCTAGEGVSVMYRVLNTIAPLAADEWTLLPAAGAQVEEGSQIAVKAVATTPAGDTVESDPATIDIPTAITIVNADGDAKVYDLNGRLVSGERQPGIYVVVESGKARKVVVH